MNRQASKLSKEYRGKQHWMRNVMASFLDRDSAWLVAEFVLESLPWYTFLAEIESPPHFVHRTLWEKSKYGLFGLRVYGYQPCRIYEPQRINQVWRVEDPEHHSCSCFSGYTKCGKYYYRETLS